MKREVTIELAREVNAWLVRYVKRQKHQRYLAASFNARDHTRASVAAWVSNQPNLILT